MKINQLQRILFLDIETVPQRKSFNELSSRCQSLWQKKALNLSLRVKEEHENDVEQLYESRAGIYAEFGKVVCISMGCLNRLNKKVFKLKLKSFSGKDEKSILLAFKTLMDQHFSNLDLHFVCGHNIKEFDLPFIARRMIINEIPLPQLLKVNGRRPWQLNHIIDTMALWKFGDYKNYTSLDLLAHSLAIESPKTDLDGSQVFKVYYKDNDLARITTYCEKDVQTTIKVFLKLNQIQLQLKVDAIKHLI